MGAILVARRDIEAGADLAGGFSKVDRLKGLAPDRLLSLLGVHCVDTPEHVLALTYDDGPDPSTTPGVLDVLEHKEERATFFVLAEPAAQHPHITRRIVEEGHEVALHGMNHRSLLSMSPVDALRSIRQARAIVEDVIGQEITLFRPPYGSFTVRQGWDIHRLGLKIALWSGDAFDWVDDHESAVAARATEAIFPGAILLLHDTRADPETLRDEEQLPSFDRGRILERILQYSQDCGYSCLTVSELVSRFPLVKSFSRQAVQQHRNLGY